MEIRKLTEADLQPLWELRLRALRDNPEAFGSTYAEAMAGGIERMQHRLHAQAHNDNFYLGAFDKGRLIGMVGFFRVEGAKYPHIGTIVSMYVAPEGRGKGVGKALMQAAIDKVRTIPGMEQIQLAVVTSNTPARRLYASLGFETYGIAPHSMKVDDQYWDEALMMLRLH